MALRTLMLKKELDQKRKALTELEAKDAGFEARKAEIEAAIDEAETDEEKATVNEAIDAYETEVAEHEQAKTDLNDEIRGLEADLEAIEEKQAEPETDPVEPEETKPEEERKDVQRMEIRTLKNMNAEQRDQFFAREDVSSYLTEIRSAIREKRAIENVGLTIPSVLLGVIRENLIDYSKLYKHVNVRVVNGEGRAIVMGTIPEAVWTDCCANLNELDLTFNDVEVDCWKVGGYFAVCNANIEDSDFDLVNELLRAIGQAIGFALDKAILYGTGTRMPLGIVTRLAQTAAPADYPATARPWVDLHETNIKTVAQGATGLELFQAIAADFGAAKGVYSRGEKVWVMNEATYSAIVAGAMAVDAGGAIVSGVNGAMPVLGGVIEVLNFVPDDVIIGGYFDTYLLAERAGQKFATSEHVRFLQDQTVLKGTARYDGQPAIAEAFVAIGINGTTPDAEMTFAPDDANSEDSE